MEVTGRYVVTINAVLSNIVVMKLDVKGLHHFSAIAGDPTENAKFYVNVLGLRMVKKTVNHDAPGMYHLFYGDRKGTPGSNLTFFPGMAENKREMGAGMITRLGLRISKNSLEYWKEHFEEENVDFDVVEWHGKETIDLEDPDGLPIKLVPEEAEHFEPWSSSKVPEEHQLQGMHHVTLCVQREDDIGPVLEEMGLKRSEESYEDFFFEMSDGSGLEVVESSEQGRMGKGSVHHIAFKAGDDEESIEQWRQKLQGLGMMPSPAISRKYFTSTYARTPVGILFEFSSMGPGYTADETVEELGTNFVLPENLESRREEIIANLPRLREDEFR